MRKVHAPRRKTSGILALAMGLTVPAAYGGNNDDATTVAPTQWLLEQVHLGEVNHQDDLVNQSLYRLELIKPDDPQVLAAHIRLLLRQGNNQQALQLLEKLKLIAPDSESYHQSVLAVKLATPEQQQKLQQARLLAVAGHLDEAKNSYDALFADIQPPVDLAVEYWQLVARLPGQQGKALEQLQLLEKTYPGNVSLRLALAQLEFTRQNLAHALHWVHQLAGSAQGRNGAAVLWLNQIKSQQVNDDSLAQLQRYLQLFKEGEAADNGRQELQRQKTLLANPAYRARLRGLTIIAKGGSIEAIAALQQALASSPNDPELLGAIGQAYSRAGQHAQAINYLLRAQAADKEGTDGNKWRSLLQTNYYWMAIARGDDALKNGQLDAAELDYRGAHNLDANDPWALIGLADVAAARHQNDVAEQWFRQALGKDKFNTSAWRGVIGLYQQVSQTQALEIIQRLPPKLRQNFHDTELRLQNALLIDQANKLADKQQWQQAAAAYQQAVMLDPNDSWNSFHYAQVLRQLGQNQQADQLMSTLDQRKASDPEQAYASALYLSSKGDTPAALRRIEQIPQLRWNDGMKALHQRLNIEQQLTQLDDAIARGDRDAVSKGLAQFNGNPPGMQLYQRYKIANDWAWLGDQKQANAILQQLKIAVKDQPAEQYKALIYRDVSRQEWLQGQAEQAREDSRNAMVASGITPQKPLDDDSYTALMRTHSNDDWLQRSIRSDADVNYRQQQSVFSIGQDELVSHGTNGYSNLTGSTTMLQADMPWQQGTAYLRSDIVHLDAGTFSNTQGSYSASFGTCQASICQGSLNQQATGGSLGIGWKNTIWDADIGSTPLGFPVVNWVGGVTYRGDWDQVGWRATMSRRPMTNSLLSYAGTKDPQTGITWGGVTATGATLGLSYDLGGDYGLWSDISAHQLTGTNVANNSRERLMGGYYYKLINEDNRRSSVGLSSMLWHYQKDLSGYTLGQGGYYSPQRYLSVAVPVNYQQRHDNWSWNVGGSVSWSTSSTKDQARYPLTDLIPDSVTDKSAIAQGSSSSGIGYTVQAGLERRVSSNWVVGAVVDIQQAKDYTPSHVQAYLRYSPSNWQGNMNLPPLPLQPYSDAR